MFEYGIVQLGNFVISSEFHFIIHFANARLLNKLCFNTRNWPLDDSLRRIVEKLNLCWEIRETKVIKKKTARKMVPCLFIYLLLVCSFFKKIR